MPPVHINDEMVEGRQSVVRKVDRFLCPLDEVGLLREVRDDVLMSEGDARCGLTHRAGLLESDVLIQACPLEEPHRDLQCLDVCVGESLLTLRNEWEAHRSP